MYTVGNNMLFKAIAFPLFQKPSNEADVKICKDN